MLRGLFARRDPVERTRRRDAERRVRALAAAMLGLPEDTHVTASEITCPDPACPGDETVILVLRPGGRTEAIKIGRPAAEVTEQDLRSAFDEAGIGAKR